MHIYYQDDDAYELSETGRVRISFKRQMAIYRAFISKAVCDARPNFQMMNYTELWQGQG
jgi:hypothetical protein